MSVDVVHLGDAARVLPDVVPTGSVDLVYIDPPFFTQAEQRGRERISGREHSFDDIWTGLTGYLHWMKDLISVAGNALRDTGSILLHCDWRASHHVRLILDEEFGPENFRNEIVWSYRKWTNSRSSLQRTHQTIFYYAKSSSHTTHVPMVEYSPTTNLDQIWQSRKRNQNNVAVYAEDDSGLRSSGAKRGVPMGDVWEIPFLNPKARERTGYPTQKPILLLERLIELTTDEGQVVLDPCCGSGTTLVAAKLLGRHWIGIDDNPEAVQLTQSRLANPIRTDSRVMALGRDSYRAVKEDERIPLALQLLQAHPVHRSRHIDGYLSPEGLRSLGLPIQWSVMIKTAPEPSAQLFKEPTFASLVDDVKRVATKKKCDLALILVSNEEACPDVQDQLLKVVPIPNSPNDIETIQKHLQLSDVQSPASPDVESQIL